MDVNVCPLRRRKHFEMRWPFVSVECCAPTQQRDRAETFVSFCMLLLLLLSIHPFQNELVSKVSYFLLFPPTHDVSLRSFTSCGLKNCESWLDTKEIASFKKWMAYIIIIITLKNRAVHSLLLPSVWSFAFASSPLQGARIERMSTECRSQGRSQVRMPSWTPCFCCDEAPNCGLGSCLPGMCKALCLRAGEC